MFEEFIENNICPLGWGPLPGAQGVRMGGGPIPGPKVFEGTCTVLGVRMGGGPLPGT